jgi:hypothetical protein
MHPADQPAANHYTGRDSVDGGLQPDTKYRTESQRGTGNVTFSGSLACSGEVDYHQGSVPYG